MKCKPELDPEDGPDIHALMGDYQSESDVDGVDLAQFVSSFGSELGRQNCSTNNPCICDVDQDGDVDIFDVIFFAEDFGRQE